MYYPIKGGSKIIVGEGFPCWLPPIPDKSQIINYGLPREEQYWKREPLPKWYIERSLDEEYKQSKDLELVLAGKKKNIFVDPMCERYRRREWFRRVYGLWFMNDGEPSYITGHHYFYIQWGKWDHKVNDGYPYYYEFSRDNFYVRQWCEENPKSLGYTMIASRGTGKSTEELATIANRATMLHNHRAAIQGKHIDDIREKLVQAKLVPMFNSLPKFFKPEYSHGTDPKEQLVFSRPSVRGKDSKVIEFGPDQELKSTIFSAMPGEKVLDGDTLGDAYATETGKTDPNKVADVHKRHGINVKTVVRNHIKVGLIREESTVEEMDEGGDECEKIWKESDPNVLDGNGFTKSKIHRHFISALDTDTSMVAFSVHGKHYSPPCNKYGKVDRNLAGIKIQADLDSVKDDLRELSSRMRKSPRNVTEAFIKDQSKSIFNIMKCTGRVNHIRNVMTKKPYVKGNLYWVNERFGPVWWERDDHAGRFNCAWMPDEFKGGLERHMLPSDTGRILNNVWKEWGYDKQGNSRQLITPGNYSKFRISTDPIKYTRTKDPRASKAAIHAFRKYDHLVDGGKKHRKDWETHNFFFEYCQRPDDPATYLEDLAMLCIFLGTKVLPERNIPLVNEFFESNGLQKLLFYPQEAVEGIGLDVQTQSEDAGFATTPEVTNYLVTRIIPFINQDIDRMPFDDTIDDWMNFDPLNPTKSHLTFSSGLGLVHDEKVSREDTPPESTVNEWFDTYDNSSVNGTFAIQEDD